MRLRRALDVGEEEGDSARWKPAHELQSDNLDAGTPVSQGGHWRNLWRAPACCGSLDACLKRFQAARTQLPKPRA